MDKKVKLIVQSITNSVVHTSAYALLLAEEQGERRIPIIVGTAEAQSIAIVMEGIQPPRPLTHDLFVDLINLLHLKLCEVFIYKFEEGVFYSQLIFQEGERRFTLDSRTSDAIAIALRVNCPIYTYEKLMNEYGIHVEELLDSSVENEGEELMDEEDFFEDSNPGDFPDETTLQLWLQTLSTDELNERLAEAIRTENYEYAKIYKDELYRREKQK